MWQIFLRITHKPVGFMKFPLGGLAIEGKCLCLPRTVHLVATIVFPGSANIHRNGHQDLMGMHRILVCVDSKLFGLVLRDLAFPLLGCYTSSVVFFYGRRDSS